VAEEGGGAGAYMRYGANGIQRVLSRVLLTISLINSAFNGHFRLK